ncbi:MAG: zf-TFIIB domain-containing protein [Pseudomonadota bacterium]
MPVSVCPNCRNAMSEVSRRGVYVDVCPSCRGVWLDGGELEKLLETADAGGAEARDNRRYASRDDYVNGHEDDYRGSKRRKRSGGVFDIFEDLLG